MQLKDYEDAMEQRFVEMFLCYCLDVRMEMPPAEIETEVCALILRQQREGIISICVLQEGRELTGFAIYQIDTPQSDWCQKEGWGFIREFYVQSSSRRQGYGKAMVRYIEQALLARGVERAYLTADDAILFWNACGYTAAGEKAKNELEILFKELSW